MQRLVRRTLILAAILFLLSAPLLPAMAESPIPSYALGLVPSPANSWTVVQSAREPSIALPAAADLSWGMPRIGYQGRQPSCVAWAVAYYCRSYQEGVERGVAPSDASRLFSPAYLYNQRGSTSCSSSTGMSLLNALQIAVSQGVATLRKTPYDPNDSCSQPSAAARDEAKLYRAAGYSSLFIGAGSARLSSIKQQLAQGTPVLLGLPVYDTFFAATAANPVIGLPPSSAIMRGGHAVTLVGYDDSRNTFKFANSWGSWWGEGGYGYLTYDYVQKLAWEAWVLYDADTTPPDLPDLAQELSGVQSGVPQSAVNSPQFTWQPSGDPTATYEVYWGPDALGTTTQRLVLPSFAPGTVSAAGSYYLRVQARDAANNTSGWRTLFVFCYDDQGEKPRSTQRPLPRGIRGTLGIVPVPNR
ncbi:MAG: C1 family peptidase [Chloroflexi bacterium]|nr:C1 family peptidase [Chloroflexota bacterium]